MFAWAPIFRHSYQDPVTKPVASAAIWYFVTLHLVVPGLIGQVHSNTELETGSVCPY